MQFLFPSKIILYPMFWFGNIIVILTANMEYNVAVCRMKALRLHFIFLNSHFMADLIVTEGDIGPSPTSLNAWMATSYALKKFLWPTRITFRAEFGSVTISFCVKQRNKWIKSFQIWERYYTPSMYLKCDPKKSEAVRWARRKREIWPHHHFTWYKNMRYANNGV